MRAMASSAFMPFDQARNALEVAVAAADDLHALDGVVVVQLNVHFLGANALGAVVIGHFYLSFSDSPHRS